MSADSSSDDWKIIVCYDDEYKVDDYDDNDVSLFIYLFSFLFISFEFYGFGLFFHKSMMSDYWYHQTTVDGK